MCKVLVLKLIISSNQMEQLNAKKNLGELAGTLMNKEQEQQGSNATQILKGPHLMFGTLNFAILLQRICNNMNEN